MPRNKQNLSTYTIAAILLWAGVCSAADKVRSVPEVLEQLSTQLSARDAAAIHVGGRIDVLESLWAELEAADDKQVSLAAETRSVQGIARWIAQGELARRDFPEVEKDVERFLDQKNVRNGADRETALLMKYGAKKHLPWWHLQLIRSRVPSALALKAIVGVRDEASLPVLASYYDWRARRLSEAKIANTERKQTAQALAHFKSAAGFGTLFSLWETVAQTETERRDILDILSSDSEWIAVLDALPAEKAAPAAEFIRAIRSHAQQKGELYRQAHVAFARLAELMFAERALSEKELEEVRELRKSIAALPDDAISRVAGEGGDDTFARQLAGIESKARPAQNDINQAIAFSKASKSEKRIAMEIGWNYSNEKTVAWFQREFLFAETPLRLEIAAVGVCRRLRDEDVAFVSAAYRMKGWREKDPGAVSPSARKLLVDNLVRSITTPVALEIMANIWGCSTPDEQQQMVACGTKILQESSALRAWLEKPPAAQAAGAQDYQNALRNAVKP